MLRVRDWAAHFENNRTRELMRMEWVPLKNRHDGDGFTELMERPDGVLHFGAWVLIVQVASKCGKPAGRCGAGELPRGTLARDTGKAHDPKSLARVTGAPEAIFAAAIPVLLEIGWLEIVPENSEEFAGPQAAATIPHPSAEIPQVPAVGGSRAYAPTDARAGVPFPSLPSGVGGPGEGKPKATQVDHERAADIARLYPAKAPKDGRPIAFPIHALALLAAKIAQHPEYDFEEHARLEASNPTPKDGQRWVEDLPNPIALEKLRASAKPAGRREYFTAESRGAR